MNENRISKHLLATRCRANLCPKDGAPLFCQEHWKLVPKELQDEVSRLYRPEFYDMRTNVRPTGDYVKALHACREAIDGEGV